MRKLKIKMASFAFIYCFVSLFFRALAFCVFSIFSLFSTCVPFRGTPGHVFLVYVLVSHPSALCRRRGNQGMQTHPPL